MWIACDIEMPETMEFVDIWVPGIGRVPDCKWAVGRKSWIRNVPHGIVEIQLSPTHWMRIPEGPL